VLANLIGNAIKYTPPGGALTVSVQRMGNETEVSVTDTSIGIAQEDLPRLGTEFLRARSDKQAESPGTGPGLSIMREQLRRFGGSLQISSALGRGLTFAAWLPLSR